MKSLWRWLLDCLEALADDDRNIAQTQRDRTDKQKRWMTYLGSGKR